MLVTGGWVQRGVLASAPLEEAVAAFNEVETTSEYLVTTTFEPAPVRTTPFAPEGLTPEPKRAAARILARFGGSGVVVFVEDDDPTVVEPPEK
jgi:hypothetical protein